MRAAFGDGKRIIWGPWCEEVFRNNPRIAKPGELCGLYWIDHYKGHRKYNSLDKAKGRWIWNYNFQVTPGEIYFHNEVAPDYGRNFVLIEPNVPWHKSVAVNKDWGFDNYQKLADLLLEVGCDVAQTNHGRLRLERVRIIKTPTFRHALAALSAAGLAVVPEGGLHHGAAAVGTSAVVIFGGFIPPEVVGYDMHVNLTGGTEACGSLNKCDHCRQAMSRISVEEVYEAVCSKMRMLCSIE
jgi:ADP-heptose:LPS heptosyltransferase